MSHADGYYYELTAPRTLEQRQVHLSLEQIPLGQVIAQTVYSAISPGTEIAAWIGKPGLRPGKIYPRLLGYCNVARVIACAEDVRQITVGDYILTHQSHRSVFSCSVSDILLSAPSSTPDLTLRKLSVSYLYHLGFMALHDGGFRPGHEVAVIGGGALGFTSASLSQAYGGRPVVLSGQTPNKDVLTALPHAHCINKSAASLPEHLSALGGADIVINTSDAWSDWQLALRCARRGGVIMVLGFPGRGLPPAENNPLASEFLYDRALTIKQVAHVCERDVPPIESRFTLKRNLAHIFNLLQQQRLDPTPLLSHRMSSNTLSEALNELEQRRVSSKTILLDWTC
jgi:threonine dehydrogenase-like Zn-dependent dehydrogenase